MPADRTAPADLASDPRITAADRHTRLRWLGIALFGVATLVFLMNVAAWVTGHGAFKMVLLGLFALGMSLGAFGTNDDTALHALADLARDKRLPARHTPEWEGEHARRPIRTAGLHASPKAALLLPLVAILAIGFAGFRGLTAWGLLP
jgi:hypothetical protein